MMPGVARHGTHRQEEPLRGTGLEQLLPLGSVVGRERDWVQGVVVAGLAGGRPGFQLHKKAGKEYSTRAPKFTGRR